MVRTLADLNNNNNNNRRGGGGNPLGNIGGAASLDYSQVPMFF